jgi:type II restriction enzyme
VGDITCAHHSRSCHGEEFSALTIPTLPPLSLSDDVRQTAELIDVIWFRRGTSELACAFEVEQSTSIYSGILRMKDLALSLPGQGGHFYLVAPETREREVVAQMTRPTFLREANGFQLGYLPSGELKAECEAMCRYGVDRSVLLKVARAHGLAQ